MSSVDDFPISVFDRCILCIHVDLHILRYECLFQNVFVSSRNVTLHNRIKTGEQKNPGTIPIITPSAF